MTTLVALAAGLGSRFGGGSAKQVAGLGPAGETLLEYAVYDALAAGFERLVCVIRPDMQVDFENALGARLRRQLPVDYALQRQDDLPAGFRLPEGRRKPWGTGQAVWACRELVRGPFGVINADDLYGPESFRLLADALAGDGPEDAASRATWQLVAFDLFRTLSPHGGVSRGVCAIGPDGGLQRIDERLDIRRGPDGLIRAGDDPSSAPLAAQTPVSMNMWGFTPSVFMHLEAAFARFLAAGEGLASGEIYLPTAVAQAMATGAARVRVHRSPAAWLGLTHPADAEALRAGLARRVEAGDYPSPLWGAHV